MLKGSLKAGSRFGKVFIFLKENPDQEWTASRIANSGQIKMTSHQIATALIGLHERNLIRRTRTSTNGNGASTYSYTEDDPDLTPALLMQDEPEKTSAPNRFLARASRGVRL